MLNRIKHIYSFCLNQKKIIENFSYLSILQIFVLLLPFVIFPYLIRVLGKELYGMIIFAQTIIAYFTIVINFGFDISATKDVSESRNNIEELSEIVSSVIFIKIILFLLSFILLLILIFFVPMLKEHALLYLLSFGYCIYEIFFPIWYFQGKEEMKFITYINIFSRAVFTILIFVFVNSKEDYLLVPILNMIGAFFAVVVSILILLKKERIKIKKPKRTRLINQARESFSFFISRATGTIIIRSNTIIIGALLGYTEVAYYDLASKITEVTKMPSNLINQTIYPRIALTKNMKIVSKIINYNFLLSMMIYVFLLIFIEPIIEIIGGVDMLPAKPIVILLSLTAPFIGVSYFLGNTMLVVNGYSKEFNLSVVYEAVIYLMLAVLTIFIEQISIYYFISIVLLCTIFEVSYRYYYVKKYKII